MSLIREIVESYRVFYEPEKQKGQYTNKGLVRPLLEVAKPLQNNFGFSREQAIEAGSASVLAWLTQVRNKKAAGFVKLNPSAEREAVQEFVALLWDIWQQHYGGDTAKFFCSKNSWGLFVDSCGFVFQLMEDEAKKQVVLLKVEEEEESFFFARKETYWWYVKKGERTLYKTEKVPEQGTCLESIKDLESFTLPESWPPVYTLSRLLMLIGG